MEELLKKYKNTDKSFLYEPVIFDLNHKNDFNELKKLFNSGKIQDVVDTYEMQLKELRDIMNQKMVRAEKLEKKIKISYEDGVWVYFPWRFSLVHLLKKEDYVLLRTSRNAHLISNQEQKTFSNAKIGFAGLNVGNPGALCVILEGGSRSMKFADFDKLSVSNLNRFRSGVCELDLDKVIISARQSYETDPFINIEIFKNGLNLENLDQFLLNPKIDLLVEEMDHLPLKIEIRKRAKKNKIPVLMVTADGIIDVERYDIDPELPILNGYLRPEIIDKINNISNLPTINEKVKLALEFMGPDFFSARIRESFELVGIKLPSIPQLSEWSFLRGALLCHFARMIINKENIPSGRYFLRLHDAYKIK